MRKTLLALLLLLADAAPARADVSPLVVLADPFVCIGALFIAVAVAWGGVWWSRHMTRLAWKKYGLPPDDKHPSTEDRRE